MTRSTHMLTGILVGAAFNAGIPATALLTLGSVLPDIDCRLGRTGGSISMSGKYGEQRQYGLITHRGLFHSAIVFMIVNTFNKFLGTGILLHICMDMFNPSGLELLWPCHLRVKMPIRIEYNGVLERIIRLLLIAAILYFLVQNTGDWFMEQLAAIQHPGLIAKIREIPGLRELYEAAVCGA